MYMGIFIFGYKNQNEKENRIKYINKIKNDNLHKIIFKIIFL